MAVDLPSMKCVEFGDFSQDVFVMDDFKRSECVRNYEITYVTDGPFSLVQTALSGPDNGIRNLGWGVALLIVGYSLALASLAWLLIDLFD
jgi:hypothetical protein